MRERIFGVAVVGLVALIAVLSVLAIQTWSGTQAEAETAMNAPNMLAVTGRVGADFSVLYVIDTDKKQMAVYTSPGGRGIQFVGARRILYDFELVSYNDGSPRQYQVQNLATKYREHKLKGEEGGSNRGRR